ncbi:IclR family transcriptional regulator [Burkholderia pseudomultivorans]|uniref:IclR family transcriptional regulator n=1 Tax=Burkholderia pseudomultivorans TaxID=1207504 RepID=A0A132EI82_9BURK|nr:helix-turn-helix domain-containing protein [Burkholderia pseudomultivorans]KWF30267.1 IclR family transcriptional regulator [Burkholderia pseudomultivorans]VWB70123.1 IclR family transcriptional regulator [Burkholderia pseudomultivorans]
MDVKTAVRVFDVINLFAEVRQPMIYSEIARRTEIPLSSCHALLQTMVAKGYLYAPGVKAGYYPTQRLLHVARDICSEDPLTLMFQPLLCALRDATGETAALATLAGNRVVYLDVVESRQKIRYSDEPGGFMSVASAAGKALLGALAPAARRRLLDSCEPLTVAPGGSFVNRETFERDIEQGVIDGWHRSTGESVEDVAGLARGFLIHGEAFALVIGAPKARLLRHEQQAVKALLDVYAQIPPSLLAA